MNLADVVFCGIAALTVLGAVLAVWLKNVFYNAMGLILSLFGVAALFIYLDAEFLAVIEVIIYIGAISIAIIFAIMLSRPWAQAQTPRSPLKLVRSALAASLLGTGMILLVRQVAWPVAETVTDGSIESIGRALLSTYALPFEVVSLVLLVAIVGALVISSSKENSA